MGTPREIGNLALDCHAVRRSATLGYATLGSEKNSLDWVAIERSAVPFQAEPCREK
jgi:hypothetical protein